MPFAHDTAAALQTAAALLNSDLDGIDRLATPGQLAVFLDEQRLTGRRDGTAGELSTVHALRRELRGLWHSDHLDQVVAEVNGLLRRTRAHPQLVRHDGWDWHLHATDADAPVADRLAAETAMALVDLIRAGDLHRLSSCAAPDCAAVFVDLSRNSSRRFCDTGCANRLHVAAHRARQRRQSA